MRESMLADSPGIVPVTFEEHRLIVVRNSDDTIHVFRNYCRHRGSQLVTDHNCANIGQRLQCPYHAWTYERDGTLVSAPNMESVADFDRSEYGLNEVPSATYGGYVWIHFDPQTELESFLQPVADQFENWSVSQLRTVATLNYRVQANWKLIFQNYNECYHCPVVHPALNRLTPYRGAANQLESGPILGGPMQLADDCETMSTDGRQVAEFLPSLRTVHTKCIHYFTIFPTIFLSTHP